MKVAVVLAVGAGWLALGNEAAAQAPLSAWVYPSASGNLLYRLDTNGVRVPDFSNCGYRDGTEPLPDVSRLIESNRWVFVSPGTGDDRALIQAAINQVAALSLNSNGFRGVVFLNAGEYQLSNSISIAASGVVLKGAGKSATSGSRLRATAARQYNLISVSGSGSRSTVSGTTHSLVGPLVPCGARSFEVDSTSGLAVGHTVIVKRPSTTAWFAAIDADKLDNPWTAGSKDLLFDRVITRIEGKWVTVDAPLPQTFESQYGGGTIYRYTWSGRIQNVGIEDLYGISDYADDTDEEHGWKFIQINNAQHVWVRRVASQYFGYSTVSAGGGAQWLTVQECDNLDPISEITGGRRYSFNNEGAQLSLWRDNTSRKGRHDYVFGATVPGPNVFLQSRATTVYSDTGPHHRWSAGGLFDGITISGQEINVQNRGNSGTGHGWAGAFMAVWNCSASTFRVRNPPTARNWLIGSVGGIGASQWPVGADPAGTYDSSGTSGQPVHPRSLYHAQLQQRLKWPRSEFREYWLGDIDQFQSAGGTGQVVSVDTAWLNQVRTLAGGTNVGALFDHLAGNRWVACSFVFNLATNERVMAAALALGLRAVGSAANDLLYLDDTNAPQSFAALGWSVGASGSTLQTLELPPALLADGRLHLALRSNTAVDFAVLNLQVAPVLSTLTNILTPVADAYVRAGSYAANNYGASATLDVKDVTASDVNREAFLRWDLADAQGRLVQAKVRLLCTSTSQAGNENVAAFVTSDSWSETGLTWNNKPASGSLLAQWLPVSGQAVEFDVTPLVTDTLLGDKKLSLRVLAADDFGGQGNVSYASRENATAANRPQLILVFSNSPPTVSTLTNQSLVAGGTLGPLPVAVGDAETPASNLVFTVTSSNPILVPATNIIVGGSGANRTLTLTTAPGQGGSATLTLMVSDGQLTASSTFVLTVGPSNTRPSISALGNQTIAEDTATAPLAFVIGDRETPANSLVLSAGSSNTNLLPLTGIIFGGSASNRTVTLVPAPDAYGSVTVTITVSDGDLSTNRTFALTVTPVNDPPEYVEITHPLDEATWPADAPLVLTADAFDVENNLSRVTYFQGRSRLGAATAPPYSAVWPNPPAGDYTLWAVATDSNGLSVTSSPISITVAVPDSTLVPTGAVWRYFDQMTDLGTAWRAAGYDDSAWASGPAPLGYGDGDEATLVASNRARVTTYFRHRFAVTNASGIARLKLEVLRDDGAVVYLNGLEVFRSNMPTGEVNWATFASSAALTEDESTNYYRTTLSPVLLRLGDNELAVQIHQNSTNSSDLSFDLALTAEMRQPIALIPPGAEWRYWDTGATPAAAWNTLAFDDAAWPAGPAQLGFGDGDESTIIASNRQITTWFRHAFSVTNPAAIAALQLRLLRDDGAAVYLNGQEVFRSNLPQGPLTPSTLATNALAGDETTNYYTTAVSPALLTSGTNLLAVEVHQTSANSSDLSFALELVATLNAPPLVSLVTPAANATRTANPLALSAYAADDDGAVGLVELFVNGLSFGAFVQPPYTRIWTNIPPGTYEITAAATDDRGARAVSVPVWLVIAPQYSLIPAGAAWKYYDASEDLGMAWRAPDYDDSAWNQGPARLGYGGDGEVTLLASNRLRITTYFRKTFSLDSAFVSPAADLRIQRDDGVVVYLNGWEIYRNNMPEGEIRWDTLATTAVSGAAETNWLSAVLTNLPLRAGLNVLAAEVHQSGANSTDLGFDLELTGRVDLEQPTLEIALRPGQPLLRWPANAAGYLLHTATNFAPGSWTPVTNQPFFTNGQWLILLDAPAQGGRFYRLQSP